jgi:hypothetical protein
VTLKSTHSQSHSQYHFVDSIILLLVLRMDLVPETAGLWTKYLVNTQLRFCTINTEVIHRNLLRNHWPWSGEIIDPRKEVWLHQLSRCLQDMFHTLMADVRPGPWGQRRSVRWVVVLLKHLQWKEYMKWHLLSLYMGRGQYWRMSLIGDLATTLLGVMARSCWTLVALVPYLVKIL